MDFLDYLARTLGCEYLSDLHSHIITASEAGWILALDVAMFPTEEYQEAARYLLGGHETYSTPESARLAVVDYLRRKRS